MEGGENAFESIASSFKSKNSDVELFFQQKAVQSTKLKTSATYIVYSFENRIFDVLGYFTLATKMLTLKRASLSKTECKEISRFGYFDEDSESYKLPAILIAQLSRNFNTESKSIKGSELMDIALSQVNDILSMTSGKTVFLECEQNKKIIQFYTDNHFLPLKNTVISKDNKKLTQLYRIL